MMDMQDRKNDIKKDGASSTFGEGELPLISVLLPTYKRSDALQRTLSALESQTLAGGKFEIIVVDDGSKDDTGQVLTEFSDNTAHRFSYCILRENGGPARARNFGLSLCRAETILIIGDDIEPDPSLVEKHLESHRQNPEDEHAVLGYVTFPKELNANGFMRWLEEGGRKYFFNYKDLNQGKPVGHLFFYTCNVSVKKGLLDKSGWFDESFPYASHEDLELGRRLEKSGMRLIYDSTAIGYHWHMLNVQGIARRVYLMGYSAVIFWEKTGDSGGPVRRTLRNLFSWCAASPPAVAVWEKLRQRDYPQNGVFALQWHSLLFLSFFIGLADSAKKKALRV